MKIKRVIVLFLVWILSLATILNAQTTKTVGGTTPTPDYTTLKASFDAINAGTITGNIILHITGDLTETASAVLNNSGLGSANYTSVTIHPHTTARIITGNLNAPLIDLNGADNVIIDGSIDGTGSTVSLTITNTNTGSAASTIRFIRSAQNNIVRYCTIKGAGTSATGGILLFSTATTGTGNNGNLINYNNITNASDATRPVNAIYSSGTINSETSGNTISNNNIFDIWRAASSSYSIQLASFTNTWTISGNSFYETTTLFAPSADGLTYNAIRISNTSGNGFVVSGNYIGGKAAQCGSTALTFNSSQTHSFQAIYLNVGSTTASSVQNNTITNFSYTSAHATPWQGIYIVAGTVNIGTTTGNTIGSSTGTGSVAVTGSPNTVSVYGINIASSGTVNCQNNSIGSFTVSNTNSTDNACSFYGINKTGSGTVTINGNTIGSTSTTSSVYASSASATYAQNVYGIYSSGSGTVSISSNTIAKMTNGSAGTSGVINGITSTSGTNIILGNTIYDLTIANANTSANKYCFSLWYCAYRCDT
jgi:hypothetical protein